MVVAVLSIRITLAKPKLASEVSYFRMKELLIGHFPAQFWEENSILITHKVLLTCCKFHHVATYAGNLTKGKEFRQSAWLVIVVSKKGIRVAKWIKI